MLNRSSKKRKPGDTKKGSQASRLGKKVPDEAEQKEDGSPEVASEALSLLIANIQETSTIVRRQIRNYEQKLKEERDHGKELLLENGSKDSNDEQSIEEKYMFEMKDHQFGWYYSLWFLHTLETHW